MKKTVIILTISTLLVITTVNNSYAGFGGAIKIGVDLAGDHEVSGLGLTGSEDVEMGLSLSGEIFGTIGNNFDLGGGMTFQFPRSQEDFQGDFSFLPIYGMARWRSSSEKFAPYAIGQLGYNFFFGDDDYKGTGVFAADLDGGLYYGIGGGFIIYKHFQIEALYSVNNGTGNILGIDFDVEYSKISLTFGYNF